MLENGEAYAFGANKYGQLGTGSVKPPKGKDDEVLETPQKCAVADVASVAAGAEFTCFVRHGGAVCCALGRASPHVFHPCSRQVTREGELLTCGLGQHGALGDGQDHSFNAKEGTIKICFSPVAQPKAVATLKEAGVKVAKVACGHNHSIVVSVDGRIWTFGNSDYCKTGHRDQNPRMTPTEVVLPGGVNNRCPPSCVVGAGSTSSWVSAQQGQLYMCGRGKTSGDAVQSMRAFTDLSGWTPRSFSAGPNTFACAAEKSAIAWGAATNGELGNPSKKTSAAPDKVPALEGMTCHQVACGNGFTLFLVDKDGAGKLPVWTPPADNVPAAAGGAADKKRKAGGADGGAKKR